MRKHVILFLAANPLESHPLKLAEECAEIQREIQLAPYRNDFHFEARWAIGIDQLMRGLMETEPTVIHFSGHGDSAGLMLQDEQGKMQPVSGRALAMMVEAAAHHVRIVVLNACYSANHAEELRTKVECIIGMEGAIGDEAARAFAIRFYGALANRRSIGNAMAQGVAALAARRLPDEVLPRCLTRDGIDASRVHLDPFAPASLDVPAKMGNQFAIFHGSQLPMLAPTAHPNHVEHASFEAADTSKIGHVPRRHRKEFRIGHRSAQVLLPSDLAVPENISALLCEMHVRLLLGRAADAVVLAAAIAEISLRTIASEPRDTQAKLGDLIDKLQRSGHTEHLAEVSWLEQRHVEVLRFTGEVRGELDDDGRHASKIAIGLALTAGLITELEWNNIRRRAALQASEPEPSALLRLDRAVHRKTFDDVLVLQRRVLILLIHGEVDQGHDHLAEIMAWRLQSGSKGRWRELAVQWPEPSNSLGIRLATLFEELAYALGVKLNPPDQDPSTRKGARAWTPALAPILAAIDASQDRLFVRHVLRWIGTGTAGDDALIEAYVDAIWASAAMRPGERVVTEFDLHMIERSGMPWSKTRRIARAERAAARAIAATLDRRHMFPWGMCVAFPELTSVQASDLVDWLRAEGGRKREDAELEADQLVSSTRGGRFDLVVQRLAALNLNRHRK